MFYGWALVMETKNATIFESDCLIELKKMNDNSVDSIVTDPPYGLSFMGKKWDYDVPSKEIWQECLRVLKPGGHLLSFGGTRTYHRLVINIEDAGFEIRDCIQWLYGSGFPKSTDVSKRIDKEAGAEREVVGEVKRSGANSRAYQSEEQTTAGQHFDTAPATEEAKQWQGWGTALKPANEPICVARKPLEKGLTVAQNVLKWGTGAINIDASRVAPQEKDDYGRSAANSKGTINAHDGFEGKSFKISERDGDYANAQGRWPANIILDEEAAAVLHQSTGLKDDVSRFFYVAKASKSDRGAGNNHPTVKPIKLMQYLIKLVTPSDGVVLDPFMGSGSTGVAARELGFEFVGCEISDEYFKIAENRILKNKTILMKTGV